MKLTHRVPESSWRTEEGFQKLLKTIELYPGAIDEVIFFIGFTHHGYTPNEECETYVPVLKKRMEILRKMGFSVGINILCTIGHLDENFDWLPLAPFQTMVGHDGEKSVSCSCIRTEAYLQYIRRRYEILASSMPDFIWVDDDVRMVNHHVQHPCFCDGCIEKFNHLVGGNYTRETLVEALDSPGSAALRRRFLEFNRDALNHLCQVLKEAVDSVNPNIRMGFMTGGLEGHSYSLSNQADILDILKADRFRPGGGFYTDEQPLTLLSKMVSCAHQNAYASNCDFLEWELEDFPICSNKSVHMHLMEMTGAVMTGCTGIAVDNVIPFETPELMNAFSYARPFWKQMTDFLPGSTMKGFCPVYYHDVDATSTYGFFDYSASSLYGNESTLLRCSLPFTPLSKDAAVCSISGEMMTAMPEDEIERVFAKGVLMDADALKVLQERGYADLAGCTIDKAYHSGMREKYVSHPLNGDSAGIVRDCFMNFWDRNGITVYSLAPLEGADVLSELVSTTGVPCGVASTIFENRLGGRVLVCSYFPWRFLEVPGKADTMPVLMDYLAKSRFPALISGGKRVSPILRVKDDGKGFMAMIINTTYDTTKDLTLRVDAKASALHIFDTRGDEIPAKTYSMQQADGFTFIKLPPLGAWQSLVILAE